MMKVAVLGAGNGAHAIAAELSLCGHEINMCELPQFKDNIAALEVFKGIELSGKTAVAKNTGFAKLNMVTTNVKEAVAGCKVIMVVVPSYGQLPFVELFADSLEDGQVVVFNPGNFGALECYKYLSDKGIKKDVIIAEAECLVYSTRIKGPAKVWIKAVKDKVGLAAIPSKRTQEALTILNQLYPQFYALDNVFLTSMNNINFVLHPTTTMLNASRIEQMGPYKNQYYDITPSIARVMTRIDEEKMEIAKVLGIEAISTMDILHRYYSAPSGKDMYETVRNTYTYSIQTSPPSLQYRYITEDIPFGLVTLASIAKQLGSNYHALATMVDLAGLLNDADYWESGRTIEDLGLTDMNAKQMVEYVING